MKLENKVALVTGGSRGIGAAIALRANSGNSQEVTDAVEHTVKEFGKLDILVNNSRVFIADGID